jgi:hypothetical protein
MSGLFFCPNGARALRGKQTGNSEAVAAIKLKAQEHATNLRSTLDDVRAQGTTRVRKIAEELNSRPWYPGAAWRRVATNHRCAAVSAIARAGRLAGWGVPTNDEQFHSQALTCHGRPRCNGQGTSRVSQKEH